MSFQEGGAEDGAEAEHQEALRRGRLRGEGAAALGPGALRGPEERGRQLGAPGRGLRAELQAGGPGDRSEETGAGEGGGKALLLFGWLELRNRRAPRKSRT